MRLLNTILNEAPQFDMWRQAICLCYRGSIAHGTYIPNNVPSSVDDKDIFGIAIPPEEYFFGLKEFEQFERKQEYWDVLVYDFRKFIRLLVKANPNVMQILWTPEKHILKTTWQFEEIVKNKHLFVYKGIYKSFCGYSYGQLHKMENMAYNGYVGEKRKALVDKFGYDCKNAQHLIRLLRQGIGFLKTGELEVERNDRSELIQIKTGQWSVEKVKQKAEELFKEIDQAYNDSKLPNHPDIEGIDKLVRNILVRHFGITPADTI
jgi:predicted nucleotidyltransferase